MHMTLGSTLSSTIHMVVTAVCILRHVRETRNKDMILLIRSSAEMRPGMFYNVFCDAHRSHYWELWQYCICVFEGGCILEVYLRRCLWLAIITVIFRLGLLWFVRQAFISAMCPWFGLRFCNYLTLQAYCSRAGALHPAPAQSSYLRLAMKQFIQVHRGLNW
jgi:hypothetical protein